MSESFKFTVYDTTTGDILWPGSASTAELAQAQAKDGLGVVPGHWDKHNHRVEKGEVIFKQDPKRIGS